MRGPSRLALLVGVVALVAGCGTPPPPQPVAAAAPVTATPTPAPAAAAPSAAAEPDPAPPAAEPDVEEAAPDAPARVRVGSIDVDAPVVAVGVDDAGLMAVPEDVRTIGWYRFGPTPGEAGSAVLSGHVDDRVQGRGAFFQLADTATGDPVTVEMGDGTVREYRVDSVENFGKADLPLREIFQRSGPERVVLITCGGEFDRATGHYVDNIVVSAVPV